MQWGPLLSVALGSGLTASVATGLFRERSDRKKHDREQQAAYRSERKRLYAKLLFLTRMQTQHATVDLTDLVTDAARTRSIIEAIVEVESDLVLVASDEVRVLVDGLYDDIEAFAGELNAAPEWEVPDGASAEDFARLVSALHRRAEAAYGTHLADRVNRLSDAMREDVAL